MRILLDENFPLALLWKLPIPVRVEIWLKAIREYFSREVQFEIFDDGKLRP
jgi:hypothetical protein